MKKASKKALRDVLKGIRLAAHDREEEFELAVSLLHHGSSSHRFENARALEDEVAALREASSVLAEYIASLPGGKRR